MQSSYGMFNSQGTVGGKRRRGKPRKMWPENIKDWTRLSIDDLDSTRDTFAKSCG